jgi:hypothetical protein
VNLFTVGAWLEIRPLLGKVSLTWQEVRIKRPRMRKIENRRFISKDLSTEWTDFLKLENFVAEWKILPLVRSIFFPIFEFPRA